MAIRFTPEIKGDFLYFLACSKVLLPGLPVSYLDNVFPLFIIPFTYFSFKGKDLVKPCYINHDVTSVTLT